MTTTDTTEARRPSRLDEARKFACQWTSRWAKIACPGLDGGVHSGLCDSLAYSVDDLFQAHDKALSALTAERDAFREQVEFGRVNFASIEAELGRRTAELDAAVARAEKAEEASAFLAADNRRLENSRASLATTTAYSTVKCLAVDLDAAERDLFAVRARLNEVTKQAVRLLDAAMRRVQHHGKTCACVYCDDTRAFLAQHATPCPHADGTTSFSGTVRCDRCGDVVRCDVIDSTEMAAVIALAAAPAPVREAPHVGVDMASEPSRSFHRCTGCEWFIDTTLMSERQITDAVHAHLLDDHTPAEPRGPRVPQAWQWPPLKGDVWDNNGSFEWTFTGEREGLDWVSHSNLGTKVLWHLPPARFVRATTPPAPVAEKPTPVLPPPGYCPDCDHPWADHHEGDEEFLEGCRHQDAGDDDCCICVNVPPAAVPPSETGTRQHVGSDADGTPHDVLCDCAKCCAYHAANQPTPTPAAPLPGRGEAAPLGMKPQYAPKTIQQKMGYLIEECGEVLAAAGKSVRWGLEGFNPELPEVDPNLSNGGRETNRHWLLRELHDLERAMGIIRTEICTQCEKCRGAGYIVGERTCAACGGSGRPAHEFPVPSIVVPLTEAVRRARADALRDILAMLANQRTSRDNEYGNGWNACIAVVSAHVERHVEERLSTQPTDAKGEP